jgi:hypothetical protein
MLSAFKLPMGVRQASPLCPSIYRDRRPDRLHRTGRHRVVCGVPGVRVHHNAQAHEIIDAITAMIINAQAGLNFLRAQSPDLEQVQQVLDSIAHEGKRAAGLLVRTRALMEKVDP